MICFYEPKLNRAPPRPLVEEDVQDFPTLHYSKKQVVRAGKILKGQIPWQPEKSEEAAQIFRIVYDWRNSHAYPMQRIRSELGGKIRRLKMQAVTAARMKRMKSIRSKLGRQPFNLVQIQDLGGCRAILESMHDVNRLVAGYRAGTSVHVLRSDRSYIDNPKEDGYRSHHLVFEFQGSGDEKIFDGRRIEVQIRTRLQHAWATAVEAMGLVRAEDLKGGAGDSDWLRLFKLMSSEFAEMEGCEPIAGAQERAERQAEIKRLDRKLGAVSTLENLAQAFKAAEKFSAAAHFKYFLLQYDRIAATITVRGLVGSTNSAETYSRAEQASKAIDSVLVEVDKIEELKEAYPNYFGDVGTLLSQLKRTVLGYDLSWVQQYGKKRTPP